ncbi:hypothetical protein FISHEDRAFT_37537 [Fistulina hepatica ATCC 64428]|uniref:VHS domain-containing protein n=1 Tax=Fistulina hepatica ATCC 64428 TaxID=1128425 RepID=A0A0D7AIX6_9AGAR|nr:hypothetical protein FISHEDRAFT_37537 [Fistulina hepatica ATCC 64428]
METFARAFSREKPHSSISDWVDILTAPTTEDEAYDGIPELVDSITLQPALGPAEASRALRKKIKHGNTHQQYRALVILKALVENCGHTFQTSFADGQLTDAFKHLATDPHTDKKVKRKLLLVLASWHEQFKGDPSMSAVTGLYKQCRPYDSYVISDAQRAAAEREQKEREERAKEKQKEKEEKEEARKRAKKEKQVRQSEDVARKVDAEKKRKAKGTRLKRPPFSFEQEKPKVLSSIAEASQASSNLVNAMTVSLVNIETDTLQSNARVQECLEKAKLTRKQVVRYIQLVENEELIGTLIETNDRIISALEMYDKLAASHEEGEGKDADAAAVTEGVAVAKLALDSEVAKLQERQRHEVKNAKAARNATAAAAQTAHLHPDLQDLSFDALGTSSSNLQPPLRPTSASYDTYDRGSLSDFSDYESSDEEARKAHVSESRRDYVHDLSADEDLDTAVGVQSGAGTSSALVDLEDPFADPVMDEVVVGPSTKY